MAHRLTDTDKWDDEFLLELAPAHKLLWIYICDKCDCSGVWRVNRKQAEFHTGMEQNLEAALAAFGSRVTAVGDGGKWLVKGFIKYQYKTTNLDANNKAHKGVLDALKRHGLEGLTSPFEGAMEKEKEKEKEKVKEKERDNSNVTDKWNPFTSLMDIFKKYGVVVTQRDPRQIAVVMACGEKAGRQVFESVAVMYCTDDFIIKQGRSINGFLNGFDRLADKRKGADPCLIKHMSRKLFLGWEGNEMKHEIYCERCAKVKVNGQWIVKPTQGTK